MPDRRRETVMAEIWETIRGALALGEKPESLDTLEMSLRAILVYLAGWAILRAGGNRFLGRETAFDIVLGFVLGSTLSRAINGSAPFFVTLAVCALLVLLHQTLAWLTCRSRGFGELMKGRPETLIRDGQVIDASLRRHQLSPGDLEEALRLNGQVARPSQVEEARYERSGEISVVEKKTKEPKVVEVTVREGVQTIRIEIQG
jgi:uncharacterized membrane protein YcaP (DUF421 family)